MKWFGYAVNINIKYIQFLKHAQADLEFLQQVFQSLSENVHQFYTYFNHHLKSEDSSKDIIQIFQNLQTQHDTSPEMTHQKIQSQMCLIQDSGSVGADRICSTWSEVSLLFTQTHSA